MNTKNSRAWHVHKFGGTSLADADCCRRVDALVGRFEPHHRAAIVVSAMGGMTDQLLAVANLAQSDMAASDELLLGLQSRYEAACGCLLDVKNRGAVLDAWRQDRDDIRDLVQAINLMGSAAQRTHDVISGYGEIWSSRLMAALLQQSMPDRKVAWVDARDILVVTQTRLGAAVKWPASRERLAEATAIHDADVIVVTGFIATDTEGKQTTLGRNGSDYSASVFAALLAAESVTIWTDVPGVMSGDPRQIPEARVVRTLSYSEAMELAYFGAKVIHPKTMGPAIYDDIPIFIRSTFEPDGEGSKISGESDSDDPIKGITSIGGLAVINLEGAGMSGVPGTAHRLFRALHQSDISVILISQASSEHSICFVVAGEVAEQAASVVRGAFSAEIEGGQIQNVSITTGCSVIAVVGDRMYGTPGVAGRFLNTLGQAGINVIAIAQGSSERNISIVVHEQDAQRAIRAVHSGFYLSPKTLSIGLIGPGTVGSTLLQQLQTEAPRLLRDFGVDLRVRAIATSRKQLLATRNIALSDWRAQLETSAEALDLEQFVNHVDADHLPHAVMIDCTADDAIADLYADWLARGIHIVTPNKKAFSGSLQRLQRLQGQARAAGSYYFYETTVGAGLPIIRTLQDLRDTGDSVHSVQGIFSGTLAYLFNTYDGTTPFSDIVVAAKEAGFTEPDPRDDLSGMDVARKLVILARELGHTLSLEALSVESLVPASLADVSTDEFLAGLPMVDQSMAERLAQAQSNNACLRYVGELSADGTARVSLQEIPLSHPFANIALTDNVVCISSDRYADNPLVIQGPGAGPEVTAAGIFADVLRLSAQLGNRR
ncbi:MAG: bifunctional aspartate kinase/homoserine dehydrogenase I [Pseudomonadota bacterium]